jgi:hypothetical protein
MSRKSSSGSFGVSSLMAGNLFRLAVGADPVCSMPAVRIALYAIWWPISLAGISHRLVRLAVRPWRTVPVGLRPI